MKHLIITLIITAFAAVTTAQNYQILPIGDIKNADGSHTYIVPQTTISVTLTIQHDSFHAGAYARYAQRFFGVPATLTDRENYTVINAVITDQQAVNQAVRPDIPHTSTAPINITEQSMTTSLEGAASEAAQMVYNLRKKRIELISGDIGEHIYGEGLRAALDEFVRLENAYLTLFYGMYTSDIQTVNYTVVPIVEQMRYIICHLNPLMGVFAANELSGEAVTIALAPTNIPTTIYPPYNPKDKKVYLPFQVADNVAFTLLIGEREIATATLPVYQFGEQIMIAQ